MKIPETDRKTPTELFQVLEKVAYDAGYALCTAKLLARPDPDHLQAPSVDIRLASHFEQYRLPSRDVAEHLFGST